MLCPFCNRHQISKRQVLTLFLNIVVQKLTARSMQVLSMDDNTNRYWMKVIEKQHSLINDRFHMTRTSPSQKYTIKLLTI